MSRPSDRLSPFACDRAAAPEEARRIPETSPPAPAGRSWLCLMERLSRGMLRKTMRNLQLGQVVLEQGSESERFGDLSQVALAGHVRVLSPKFFRRILSDGVLGAAESYLEGEWISDELTDVFRVLLKNEHVIAKFSRPSRGSAIFVIACSTSATAIRVKAADVTSTNITTLATASSHCSSTPR